MTDIKTLVKSILAGVELDDSVTKEQLEQAHEYLSLMKAKIDASDKQSLDKAIKPGKPLNYKEMKPPVQSESPSETGTIDYSGDKPKLSGKQWKTSDIKKPTNVRGVKIDRDKEARVKAATKRGEIIDDRQQESHVESAMDTIKRRQKERSKL